MSEKKSSDNRIVILPGWGGTAETWKRLADALQQRGFSVCVIELPCFGNEPCPSDVWGVEEYAEFVRKKVELLQPVAILGHSFGGQVAVRLLGVAPNICKALILSGAAIIRPKNSIRKCIFGALSVIGKALFSLPLLRRFEKTAKTILYKAADSPDYQKTSGTERAIFQKVLRQDVFHLLPNIALPVLVLWGSNDTYTPLRHGKLISAALPHSTLKIFPGGKHGLHLQQPEKMTETIRDFIQRSI